MGNPIGSTTGDEESIAVLEVKNSSGTIITETALVRTGHQALNAHVLGLLADLQGNVQHTISIYVGLKNFDPSSSLLGFSQGYVQAIGLSV